MALIEFSGAINSIKGKIGGTIYQEGPAGPIARARCLPVNRNTIRKVKSKSIAVSVQFEWLRLTNAQRNLWDGFVQYNPIHQQRNTSLFINGQMAFFKANHIRLEYGFPILKEPQFNKCDFTPIDVDLRLTAGSLFADFDRAAIPTEEFVVLFVTIPVRETWNNSRGLEKLLVFTTVASSSEDITTEYFNLYQKNTAPGDTLFFRFTNANKLSGLFFPYKTKKVTL